MKLRRAAVLLALAAVPSAAAGRGRFDVVGFAAVDADGLATTTGGAGGPTVAVSGFAELAELAAAAGPYVIEVSGTISGSGMLRLESDKTLIGLGDDAVIEGFGITIVGARNIIVRNLSFTGSGDDAINVERSAHHVWIDHCDFAAARDGLIDIKRGSSWITVSWNRFRDHGKTCLLGHSDDNAAEDTGRLKVTYHHNWFQRTRSRHPRVRFGECHVFNNFYDRVTDYGIASTQGADVLVEANYFVEVPAPTLVGYAASGPGDLEARKNLFLGSGAPETAGTVFEPSVYYAYEADRAEDVPTIVRTGAGVAGFVPSAGTVFVRGDANGDGHDDIADAVRVLLYLFGGAPVDCERTADVDDSGGVTVSDAVHLLRFLFRYGPPPAAPFPGCGADRTDDTILCERYSGCG